MRRTMPTLSSLALILALLPLQASAERCFPELADEVLVYFEAGELASPVVVGSLWNGQDAPPEDAFGGQVTAPRVVAKALLAAVDASTAKRDASAGAVARWLVETASAELEALARTLDAAYEASFVEAAGGGSLGDRLGIVAGLGSGTFRATVDASIQQMEAYAALLEQAASEPGADSQVDDSLLAVAAELITLDLALRDPDCD